jgi:hypothetical protein
MAVASMYRRNGPFDAGPRRQSQWNVDPRVAAGARPPAERRSEPVRLAPSRPLDCSTEFHDQLFVEHAIGAELRLGRTLMCVQPDDRGDPFGLAIRLGQQRSHHFNGLAILRYQVTVMKVEHETGHVVEAEGGRDARVS